MSRKDKVRKVKREQTHRVIEAMARLKPEKKLR
jgi:hypothetical protein